MSPCCVASRSIEMLSSEPLSSSSNHIESKAFAGIFQNALRLLRLLENFGDLGQRRNFGDDVLAQQQADLVDHHQLAGIGDGDGQPAIFGFFQRHEVVAEHQVNRDGLEQIVVKLEVMQVNELAAIAACNVLRFFQFFAVSAGAALPLPPTNTALFSVVVAISQPPTHRPEPYFSS